MQFSNRVVSVQNGKGGLEVSGGYIGRYTWGVAAWHVGGVTTNRPVGLGLSRQRGECRVMERSEEF